MTNPVQERWDEAAVDPDTHGDLDYELEPLTIIKLEERLGGRYMILPGDETDLDDEAFIVADPGSLCRLSECR